jgi:hypothetical protein
MNQYGFNKVWQNIEKVELPKEPTEFESNVSRKFKEWFNISEDCVYQGQVNE